MQLYTNKYRFAINDLFKKAVGLKPMDSLTNLAGSNDSDNLGNMFSLSYTNRMYAFIGCVLLGFVLSFIGTLMVSTGNLSMFGVLFSIGNILSLFATGFLIGFKRQLKGMFASTRIFATIAFLVCLVMTIVFAVAIKSVALVIVFVILQYLALAWYSLSYIPYARDAVRRMFTT
eukprot:NODE_390_length_9461_cov_0.447768.p3 type:complete len:174 gc:universal NODE_390_length_9461_cov_0.447768:1857-1336(-)